MSYFDKFSSAVSKAAGDASRATQKAAIDAEKVYIQEQINGFKKQWGKENFDLAIKGDMSAVQRNALQLNIKIAPLEAKLTALDHKKDLVDAQAGGNVQSAGGSTYGTKIVVTIPAGSFPGSVFHARGPSGQLIPVTVPAGSQPGDSIEVVIPP